MFYGIWRLTYLWRRYVNSSHMVISKISMIVTAVAFGIGNKADSPSGFNYGAKQYDRVGKILPL